MLFYQLLQERPAEMIIKRLHIHTNHSTNITSTSTLKINIDTLTNQPVPLMFRLTDHNVGVQEYKYKPIIDKSCKSGSD